MLVSALWRPEKVMPNSALTQITQELKHVLDSVNSELSPEQVMKMINELDDDGSGRLDYAEFKQMMNH